jgi:predicted PurR-regulated permease PerM
MKNSSEIKTKQIFETILQLGVVFLILGFCFKLLLPFMMPILWAIILAIVFYPMFNFLQKKLKGRKSLASIIITTTVLLFIIVPTIIFFNSLTSSVLHLKAGIADGSLTVNTPNPNIKNWPIIGEKAYDSIYSLSHDLKKGLMQHKKEILELFKIILGTAVNSLVTVLMIILSIIIAGVLMVSKSAQDLATNFVKRIAGNSGDEYLDMSVSTVHQVVKGILGVAIIQTLLQAIGLFGADIPFAGILTLLCLILSIIQIGPFIVNVCVFVYLFSQDDTTSAIIWTVFFMLSGLSDNVLKPWLLGKGAMVPMLVIFLGVIGGFIMSGFVGLFVGPIVFSIGYKLFVAWMEEKPDHISIN